MKSNIHIVMDHFEFLFFLVSLYNSGIKKYLKAYIKEANSRTLETCSRSPTQKNQRLKDFISLVRRAFPGNNHNGGAEVVVHAASKASIELFTNSYFRNKDWNLSDYMDNYDCIKHNPEEYKENSFANKYAHKHAVEFKTIITLLPCTVVQKLFGRVLFDFSKKSIRPSSQLIYRKCFYKI